MNGMNCMGGFSGMRGMSGMNFDQDMMGMQSGGPRGRHSFGGRDRGQFGGVNPQQFGQFSANAMHTIGGMQRRGHHGGHGGMQGGMSPQGMTPASIATQLDGLTKNANGGVDLATFKADLTAKSTAAGRPAPTDPQVQKMFSLISNGNAGEITAARIAELKTLPADALQTAAKTAAFTATDTNNNGSIDITEFGNMIKAKFAEMQAAITAQTTAANAAAAAAGQPATATPPALTAPTDAEIQQQFAALLAQVAAKNATVTGATASTTPATEISKADFLAVQPQGINGMGGGVNGMAGGYHQHGRGHGGFDMYA
jgi:Ca2+-binding EF-hand superfamily protein